MERVPTIEEAIKSMKYSIGLFLTKGGWFYSTKVQDYMKDKEIKYLPYVKENMRDEFVKAYSWVFQMLAEENADENAIAQRLRRWEQAGDVMMLLSENTDWTAVDELLKTQAHTKETMSHLLDKVRYYSAYGMDFWHHILRR